MTPRTPHEEPVDWMQALREACSSESQAVVGARIGYSGSVVSQVLSGKYRGRLDHVREAVEGALLGATVECPVLGTLARHLCIEHQGRPFAATNPVRVQLYHACRDGCRNSRAGQGNGGTER